MLDFLNKRQKNAPSAAVEGRRTWRLWRRNLTKSQDTIAEEARVATSQLEELYENRLKEAEARLEEKFDKFFAAALVSFTKDLSNFLVKEEEKAKIEVAAYKVKTIEAVSQRAPAVLAKVTKIVLGKSLTSQDQEDLIMEAIDQAKKEEFLWN